MEFKRILQNKRKELGLTQEELAEKLFVSGKTISNWETGKTTPDIDNVIFLSNYLKVSLNDLLLEGSDMVENIKKQSEIKETRMYLVFSSITNLVFLFILACLPLLREVPLFFSIAIALGTFTNCLCVIYFSNRYVHLSGKSWKNQSKSKKVWTMLSSVLVGIILLVVVFYVRFVY